MDIATYNFLRTAFKPREDGQELTIADIVSQSADMQDEMRVMRRRKLILDGTNSNIGINDNSFKSVSDVRVDLPIRQDAPRAMTSSGTWVTGNDNIFSINSSGTFTKGTKQNNVPMLVKGLYFSYNNAASLTALTKLFAEGIATISGPTKDFSPIEIPLSELCANPIIQQSQNSQGANPDALGIVRGNANATPWWEIKGGLMILPDQTADITISGITGEAGFTADITLQLNLLVDIGIN